MKEIIGKHKKTVIILLIFIAAVVTASVFMSQAKAKKAEILMAESMPETAQIERRTLVESVSATGRVVSVESKNVKANVTGVKVESVNVKVGDKVAEGDILCIFDATDIEENLADARTMLNATQRKTQVDVSAAARSLSEAETNRNIGLERADEDVADAWNDYLRALTDLEEAEDNLDEAKETLETIKKDLEKAGNTIQSTVSGSDMVQANYQELQNKYNAAQQSVANYEAAYDMAVSAAESKLDVYNQKVRGKEDTIRNNDSTVSSREDSLTTSRLNASASGLTDKQQIKRYEEQIAECMVTAPMGGIVTAVNVEVGDTYSGAPIITIEDTSAYEISAEIEEYDIGVIEVGQKVVFKTNGTGDMELNGTVKEIAPRATVGGANVTYTVTISIDTPCDKLKMDMTAKLSIILESKENVLTVPYDSVQEDDDGNFYIEVIDADAQTEKIFITKGIESDYYVEVIGNGIEEGMSVIVPVTSEDGLDIMEMMRRQGPMGGF